MSKVENKILKKFEATNVTIEIIEGVPMFELYSTGMALGYVTKAKGKMYPHKNRIDKIIKITEISTVVHNNKKYINIDDVRKLITYSHSECESKIEFIKYLKDNKFLDYNEVFGTVRKESKFFDSLDKVISKIGYKLDRQVIDCNYRYDGMIKKLNLIIEFDEFCHASYDKDKEFEREKHIFNSEYNLVRVSDSNDIYENIGIVIKKILEVSQHD